MIEDKQQLVEQFGYALELREELKNVTGLMPRITVTTKGIKLDIKTHLGDEGIKNVIRNMVKGIKTEFRKSKSRQGFLMYSGNKNGIEIVLNTYSCFYGGTPNIEVHPRTRAICPIKEGEKNVA